jgi:N-acetylmuramoyl-L-alanine amidase
MKNIWLAVAGSWMALTTGWAQDPVPQRPADAQPVRIHFTHLGTFGDEGARLGDEVFAPPSLVRRWGWDVTTRYNDADITIDSRTLRVSMILVKGRPMVSLSDASRAAGARTQWSPDGKTYFIRSWVRNIEQTSDGLRIDGTLPIKARAFRLSDPPRLVLDLDGAELNAASLPPLPEGWRAGQLTDGTVRVVIERPEMSRQGIAALPTSRTITMGLVHLNPQAAPPLEGSTPTPPANPKPVKGGPPAILSGLSSVNETGTEARFFVPATGGQMAAPVGSYVGLSQIRIRVPNARATAPEAWSGSGLVTGIRMTPLSGGIVDFLIDTAKPMGFEALPSRDGLTLRFFLPPGADGTLMGKTIVIDPGHGGNDPGAVAGGAKEKVIALALSKYLADELTEAGAKVILTRSTDVFIPLNQRAAVANDQRADLFLSIHVNSNTVANTASGSKMFYHRSRSLGMLLATAIDQEFKALGRLPSMGTWSDTRIYKSGFAVLRGADMPSVLVETGFINHSKDRAALVSESYQREMAKAIVRALRVYLGEEPKP